MNVREEDKRKTGSSSTGFGLATAAIGLGIGAALYYFLSKDPPHPETEGATSSGRTHERVFRFAASATDSDSYSTISEGTTSDTSVHDRTFELPMSSSVDTDYATSDNESSLSQNSTRSDPTYSDYTSSKSDSTESDISISSTTESESADLASGYSQSDSEYSQSDSDNSQSESEYSETESDYAESDISTQSNEEDAMDAVEFSNLIFENASNTESLETGYVSLQNLGNSEYDSETAMEWDVTNSSLGIPSEERSSSLSNFIGGLANMISPKRPKQDERLSKLRERAFRERPWTLEECSICFDVMLRDQEIMTLSCTHNFHAQCIMPWLQEKQTCPNCRKNAD